MWKSVVPIVINFGLVDFHLNSNKNNNYKWYHQINHKILHEICDKKKSLPTNKNKKSHTPTNKKMQLRINMGLLKYWIRH